MFIDGETLFSQEGITQGDPLAMAMYAIAVNPLIHQLNQDTAKQVWFTDDATAGGKLNNLRDWWDCLTSIGPDYGYFPNTAKTWLIEEYKDKAVSTLEGTQVVITEEGKKYLGSAIGKQSFIESYVQQKITTWVASIAITQPHAVFAAFTHGLTSRWMYLARTTPNIEDLIKPLEDSIRNVFLPTLTGQNASIDSRTEAEAEAEVYAPEVTRMRNNARKFHRQLKARTAVL